MRKSIGSLRWNAESILSLYSEFYRAPVKYLDRISVEGTVKDALFVLLCCNLLIVFPLLLDQGFSVIIPALISGLFFVLAANGILHLLRGFLSADGDFKSYLNYTAWISILLAPLYLLVTLTSIFSILSSIGSLVGLISFLFWWYGFHLTFRSSATRTAIVGGASVFILFGPALLFLLLSSQLKTSLSNLQPAVGTGGVPHDGPSPAIEPISNNDRESAEAESAKNECHGFTAQYDTALKHLYITKGPDARTKALSEMRISVKKWDDWLAEAGGEEALLARSKKYPEEGQPYQQMILMRKCLKSYLSRL